MTTSRHSELHQFSLLLNASTAAAKVSQALAGHETPKSWAQSAKDISAAMLAKDGKKIEAPSLTPTRHGWGDKLGSNKPSYFDHPLTMPAASFAALELSVSELGAPQIEQAAQTIAKQLVVAFEKDGVPHLAFPHQGNGLKIRKRKKGPMEVFDWNSDWGERARTILPDSYVFGNNHGKYRNAEPLANLTADENAALDALHEYYSHIQLSTQIPGFLGEFATRGVHAGGKLSGSANTEEPLATLARDTSASKKQNSSSYDPYEISAVGFAYNESFDPTSRRLAWGSIALLLGDQFSAAEAASAHCSPAMRAEASIQFEAGAKQVAEHGGSFPSMNSIAFPGASRAKKPAMCAMQAATTLASTNTNNGSRRSNSDQDFLDAFAYSAKPGMLSARKPEAILADHKAAKSLVEAIEAKSKAIMDLAYAKARQIEADWIDAQGLTQAISDAKLLGSGKASAKSLNWALSNPAAAEGMRKASSNPELGFSAKSARYLGLRAEGEGQTIERAKAAWAQRGLGDEGFLGASSNEDCVALLSGAWTAELEEKKKERKPFLKMRVELLACALQAGFASGSTPEQAKAFAHWCSGDQQRYFLRDPQAASETDSQDWDRLHPDMPPREIALAAEAQKFSIQARARADGFPSAMKAVFRAFAFGEDMPARCSHEGPGKEREKLASSWLALAARGPGKSPSIDWTAGLGQASLRDLAQRSSGTLGAAMRSAAKDGPHGAFSARAAIGLGIEGATDANDLVAKVRDKLRGEFAMSDAGWKSLAKAPAEMVEHMARQFEKRIPEVLESRAKHQSLLGASAMKSQEAVGLGLSLLSGAACFGLDLKDASLVEELGRLRSTGERSELLRHGIRPIVSSSAQSADFARAEAIAKAERLPRIAKSMGEKIAKISADLIGQGNDPEAARAQAKRMLSGDIALIDDWLKNSEDGVWQTLPAKAGFPDLMRRQAVWHEDTAARVAAGEKAGKAASKAWPTPLLRHADGEWSAVLLGTADELTEEGRAMRHCVSSYSGTCRQGASRIYSVRLNGERMSTLELKLTEQGTYKNYDHQHPRESDAWKINQNNGKCNAAIKDPSALAFCAEVAERMNHAHIQWCKDLALKRSEIAQQASQTRKNSNIKIS